MLRNGISNQKILQRKCLNKLQMLLNRCFMHTGKLTQRNLKQYTMDIKLLRENDRKEIILNSLIEEKNVKYGCVV